MQNLYIVVGPDFSEKGEIINKFLSHAKENIQIINEGAIIRALQMENVSDLNYRYKMISTIVRSHLLAEYDVIANCDNLSIEALVLWRNLAKEHEAKCIIVLFDAELCVDAMNKLHQLNLPDEQEKEMTQILDEQFKRFEDLKLILKIKTNTIRRDLADEVWSQDEFSNSQEENK